MIPALLFAAVAAAAAPQPEIDSAEIMRLGDMVQHVGGGIRQEPTDRFVEAMAVPASDADRWFISVLTMQGCAPCEKLKAAWQSDEWLRSLADPHDPRKSWAHLTWYSREDKSQAFRFENLKVSSYPTIIVQPPRTGRYGDPSTVVYQGGYGGDPEKLARQITDAIKLYVQKCEPKMAGGVCGYDPPWEPTPKADPLGPDGTPVFPDGRPLIPPPAVQPVEATGLLPLVMTAVMAGLLMAFAGPTVLRAFNGWMAASRARREALDALLSEMANGTKSSTAAGSKRSPKRSAGSSK